MTDKADKVHPIVEKVARAIANANVEGGTCEPSPHAIECAKAAAKVLIEECAKVAEQEREWRNDYYGETLIGRRFLTGPEAAECIRALKTELGLEG